MKKSRKIYIAAGIGYLLFVAAITLYTAVTYPDRLPKVYLCRPQSDMVSYETVVETEVEGSLYHKDLTGYTYVALLNLNIPQIPEDFLEEGKRLRVEAAEPGIKAIEGIVVSKEVTMAEDEYTGEMEVEIGLEAEDTSLDGAKVSIYIEEEKGPFPYVVPGTAIYQGGDYPDVLYFVVEQEGPFGYEYILREEMVSCWPELEGAENYAIFTASEIKYPVVAYSEDFIYDGATVQIGRGEELENER